MILDVSESRLIILFYEGLTEPLRGRVKDFKPNTLQDAIWKTSDLEGATTKNKFNLRPPITQRGNYQRVLDKCNGKLDELQKGSSEGNHSAIHVKNHGSPSINAREKEKFTT
jgi:hypothetical protein